MMNKVASAVLGLGILVGCAAVLPAQEKKGPASPLATVSAAIGGKKVTITYSRPYKKGRAIFGGLVPLNELWRTGANAATTFATEGDVMLGSLHVPAGTYAMFTIPGEKEWTLVLSKVAKQMGAFEYDQKNDLGRAKMSVSAAPATEQFTIAIEPKGGNSGVLKLTWDTTTASIDVMMH